MSNLYFTLPPDCFLLEAGNNSFQNCPFYKVVFVKVSKKLGVLNGFNPIAFELEGHVQQYSGMSLGFSNTAVMWWT